MKDMKHDLKLRLMKLLAVVFSVGLFALCWFCSLSADIFPYFWEVGNWLVIVLFLALYVMFARIYDAFLVSLNRISEMIYSQCLAVLISDGIMFVVIWLLKRSFPDLLPCLATLAAQMILVSLWCILAHKWYFKAFAPSKTAVIYDSRYDVQALLKEYGLTKKFDVQITVDADTCEKNPAILADCETVFICGAHSHGRNTILKYCIDNGICAYVLPRIGDLIMGGAKKMHMFHLPMLRVSRWNPKPEYRIVKRLFDIFASALVLLLLSPVMLITAIAIKATDGGPVFYKQNRLTKDGKIFKVLKFRSMRVDAEKDGVARLSTGDKDNRITPVGRIIRKVRIDELPQLINILMGSMSVVGPRPERPEIAAQYEQSLPEFRLRLQAKAGLTGYAQVYGKYNTTPYDKLQMDLMYIAKPSLLEDLRIIFATIKIIFIPESTAGIAEGQTTAATTSETEKDTVGAGKE